MNITVKITVVSVLAVAILSGCAGEPRFTSRDSGYENVREPGKKNETGNSETGEIPVIDIPENAEVLESKIGVASFYGEKFNGRGTANGEKYNIHEYTAAHKTYPFNTIVRVTNLLNDMSVVVRINDRKPDLQGRIIDLSLAAAKKLDMVIKGITKVKVEVISWGK